MICEKCWGRATLAAHGNGPVIDYYKCTCKARKAKSMQEGVRGYLLHYGYINRVRAMSHFKCWNLALVIHRLRNHKTDPLNIKAMGGGTYKLVVT